ncbi:HD-GYP domain-containing protein [Nitratidesulfovibrio sp. SRB-5]|uniref:HD-GYP domain-containing protein n=1 Tax=Nitratidesulfovibrio sp. SRB-5 TaxID=2872636 RepID=UPI002958C932|nr:HD-GYP domain-containing protein [Nitratidesulfovibrio sp. SRB-5]MBZ2172333.1 HD-GYP domain-containing protein [Nitratidesulfovibrio sp. SRB-5]
MLSTLLHQFAESLGNAIDAKDTHTRSHSEEVALAAFLLARAMGFSPADADRVHVAGHLHDIGKIGVPDAVLLKAGTLTPEEWEHMRAHPVIGARIVSPVADLADEGVASMILHHHERWDGRGYPHGLSGDAIPLGARIIALADSLSAMLQHRPYRPAMRFEQAEEELLRCSGSQFDPAVVRAFVTVRDEMHRAFSTPQPPRSGLDGIASIAAARCCRPGAGTHVAASGPDAAPGTSLPSETSAAPAATPATPATLDATGSAEPVRHNDTTAPRSATWEDTWENGRATPRGLLIPVPA